MKVQVRLSRRVSLSRARACMRGGCCAVDARETKTSMKSVIASDQIIDRSDIEITTDRGIEGEMYKIIG